MLNQISYIRFQTPSISAADRWRTTRTRKTIISHTHAHTHTETGEEKKRQPARWIY